MNQNPYAPPVQPPWQQQQPPPPPNAGSANIHVTINAVLVICGTVLALFAVASALLQVGGAAPEPPAGASLEYAMGYQFGRLLFTGLELALLVMGGFAAYGLLARRPWAPRLTFVYWLVGFFSCCLTLPAIYGLFSTSRPGFRALFGRPGGVG